MINIIYGYYVSHGGIGRFISETLKHVKDLREYEILTIEKTIDYPREIHVNLVGCKRDNSFLSNKENRNFSLAIKRIVKNRKDSIQHSHGIYQINPHFYTAHICLAAYLRQVERLFGKAVAGDFSDILRTERIMLEGLEEDKIFPVSKKVAGELSEFYGFDEQKFTVVSGASRFRNRNKLKNKENKIKRVGLVGNNIYAKGMLMVCDIIRRLRTEGTLVEGIFVGCDENTQRTIRSHMDKGITLVEKTQIGEEFYRSLDSYMCLSAYEGYSLSTLEAMSLGVPVISSSSNGVFFDAKIDNPKLQLAEVKDITNQDEIVEITKRILYDERFKRKIIKSGLEITKNRSWKAVARYYEQQYATI